jgi:hypothetical protein
LFWSFKTPRCAADAAALDYPQQMNLFFGARPRAKFSPTLVSYPIGQRGHRVRAADGLAFLS